MGNQPALWEWHYGVWRVKISSVAEKVALVGLIPNHVLV